MESSFEWTLLCTVASEVEAHVIEGVLNSHGIPTRLSYESAARLFGITTGALGGIKLYVPPSAQTTAQKILDAQIENDSTD